MKLCIAMDFLRIGVNYQNKLIIGRNFTFLRKNKIKGDDIYEFNWVCNTKGKTIL